MQLRFRTEPILQIVTVFTATPLKQLVCPLCDRKVLQEIEKGMCQQDLAIMCRFWNKNEVHVLVWVPWIVVVAGPHSHWRKRTAHETQYLFPHQNDRVKPS